MADHSDTPYKGDFPDVKDEAAASPRWLPGLGFAILCLLATFIAIQAAGAHGDAATEGPPEGTIEATPVAPSPAAEEAAH